MYFLSFQLFSLFLSPIQSIKKPFISHLAAIKGVAAEGKHQLTFYLINNYETSLFLISNSSTYTRLTNKTVKLLQFFFSSSLISEHEYFNGI